MGRLWGPGGGYLWGRPQGMISLVLNCIDRLNVYSTAAHFAEFAGEEAAAAWKEIVNLLYELLGEDRPQGALWGAGCVGLESAARGRCGEPDVWGWNRPQGGAVGKLELWCWNRPPGGAVGSWMCGAGIGRQGALWGAGCVGLESAARGRCGELDVWGRNRPPEGAVGSWMCGAGIGRRGALWGAGCVGLESAAGGRCGELDVWGWN